MPKLYVNHQGEILGFSPSPAAFGVDLPDELLSEKFKVSTVQSVPMRNAAGLPLYKAKDGKITTLARNFSHDNEPLYEFKLITHTVSIHDEPSAFGTQDVLEHKYECLSRNFDSRNFWFTEFFDSYWVDSLSSAHTGFHSVTIQPGGFISLKTVQLAASSSKVRIKLECSDCSSLKLDLEESGTRGLAQGSVFTYAFREPVTTLTLKISLPKKAAPVSINAIGIFY